MIPEELIEEIAFTISEKADYDIETDLYDGLPTGATMTNAEELATEIITRIAQAIARGEMELPDEVGRKENITWWADIDSWQEQMADIAGGRITLIAFRPPAGIPGDGQEEEK